MERVNEMLADYIDDMIMNPGDAQIDISSLPEDYQRLAENIRSIQTVLRNMTWHTEKLENSFNDMVSEMKKRTSALENERNLFIQFTESAKERIVVLDEENGEMLFGNRMAREFHQQNNVYMEKANELNIMSKCGFDNPYNEWVHEVRIPDEAGVMSTQYFQVHSIYIIWENRGAIAHMFSDVTEMQKVRDMAMKDPMTNTYNRRFAMEYMKKLADGNKKFALAFIDVDYLKYCNDEFGHHAGDVYLIEVAEMLQGMGSDKIVCRTGGDEFVVICPESDMPTIRAELEERREELNKKKFDTKKSIHKSFSFGIAAKEKDDAQSIQMLLGIADEKMYQDKLENKRKNHVAIHDERLI